MRPEPFVNRGVALQLGRWSIDRMAGRFRGVAYRFPSPASTPERRCCLLSNEFGVFGLGACVHVVGLLTFVWSNAAHACDVMHHACCMPASHGICPRPAGARTARYILPFQIADCERRSQRGRDRAQTHPRTGRGHVVPASAANIPPAVTAGTVPPGRFAELRVPVAGRKARDVSGGTL